MLHDLNTNVLAEALRTEPGEPVPGKLSGHFNAIGPVGDWQALVGRGELTLADSNFVNTDILGSMEFGCAAAGAKVILVLGHGSCGAVVGTIDNVELGNLTATLQNIRPAVNASSDFAIYKSQHWSGHEFREAVIATSEGWSLEE